VQWLNVLKGDCAIQPNLFVAERACQHTTVKRWPANSRRPRQSRSPNHCQCRVSYRLATCTADPVIDSLLPTGIAIPVVDDTALSTLESFCWQASGAVCVQRSRLDQNSSPVQSIYQLLQSHLHSLRLTNRRANHRSKINSHKTSTRMYCGSSFQIECINSLWRRYKADSR
jgi:hypothetical protein